MTDDVVTITQNLIRCPSVTPEDAGVQKYLAGILEALGFECHHLQFEDISNLFARIGSTGPHICFAGHTDVVPPGPEDQWKHPPFAGVTEDGKLYGRGAADMKGAVAAFTAGAAAYLSEHGPPGKGSISLLITGDEEGPAVNGTVKVLEWMKKNNHVPDVAIVGEPSNPKELGQEIKIGRRGSLSGRLAVRGKQGHVAYPHLADNPLPVLVSLLKALSEHEFDKGTEFFQATHLEVTNIDVGNTADNVIPPLGRANFNVRFNDKWTAEKLKVEIEKILRAATNHAFDLDFLPSHADSFFSPPGDWANLVRRAVIDVTGKTPEFTTYGGASDARFVHKYCPVVEVGAVNDTIHQIDEHAKIADLEGTAKVYQRILELYLG